MKKTTEGRGGRTVCVLAQYQVILSDRLELFCSDTLHGKGCHDSMLNSIIARVVLSTLFGGAGSILLGFLFYHYYIFKYHNSAFQFIMFGFCFAYLYSALENKVKINFAVQVLIILLINVIVGRSLTANLLIRDLIYIFLLSVSVLGIHRAIEGFRGIFVYRIALWGIIFGAGYIAAVVALTLIHRHDVMVRMVSLFLKHGLLMGVGIGSGLEIARLISRK